MLDGCPVPWAFSIAGADVVASDIAPIALKAGGHLHIGLEFFGGDVQMPTNRELVEEAVELCGEVSRPVATSGQAAQLLDLPG